jgi:two-component system invasion response regulator UvrY
MHPSAVISDKNPAAAPTYDDAPNILLADDHRRFNQQTRMVLFEGLGCNCSIEEAHSVLETLHKLHQQRRALLILDLNMSDQRGLELLRIVQATHLHTRILVICSFTNPREARTLLRAGAHGYLDQREANSEELLSAVQCVLAGRHYISDTLCEVLSHAADYRASSSAAALSTLERQLVGKMLMGCSLATLAAELDLPAKSISARRARVMAKISGDYARE